MKTGAQLQDFAGHTAALPDQPLEDVLRGDMLVIETFGLRVCQSRHVPYPIGEVSLHVNWLKYMDCSTFDFRNLYDEVVLTFIQFDIHPII